MIKSILIEKHINCVLEILYIILLMLSPLFYYPRIDNFSHLPKILIVQSILCIIIFLWIIRWSIGSPIKIFFHPISIAIILWLTVSGTTIGWAVDKYSGFTIWIHWAICMLGMMFLTSPALPIENIDRIMLASCIGAGIISFIGMLQYVWGIDFIPQSFVPGATFSNKNLAAEFVLMIWPLTVMGFILADSNEKSAFFAVFFMLITVFLLYAKTRATWVSLILNIIFFGGFIGISGCQQEIRQFINRQKYYWILAALCFIAVMANMSPSSMDGSQQTSQPMQSDSSALSTGHPENVTPNPLTSADDRNASNSVSSDTSANSNFDNLPHRRGYADLLSSIFKTQEGSANFRLTAWLNTLRMISDNVWGVGLANWYVHYPLYQRVIRSDPFFSLDRQPLQLHNEVLQLFAETSLIGLLCYVGLFAAVIQVLLSINSAGVESAIKIRLLFSIMAIGCFFINSLFSFPLRMSIPPLYLMMLLAVIISLNLRFKTVPFISITIGKGAGYVMAAVFLSLSVWLANVNIKTISSDFHYANTRYFHNQKQWNIVKYEAEKAIHDYAHGHKLWLELGIANANLGLLEQAITAFKEALKIHPNHLNSLMNISNTCFQMKRFDDAAIYMNRAIAITPDNERTHFNLGVIHEKMLKYADAVRDYEAALNIKDSYLEARYRLAVVLIHENRLDDSFQQLTRIIAEKPDFRSARYYLGMIYKKWDQKENATEAFRKEIEFHPDHTQAMKQMRELME